MAVAGVSAGLEFSVMTLLPELAGRTLDDVSGDQSGVRAERPEGSPRFTRAA